MTDRLFLRKYLFRRRPAVPAPPISPRLAELLGLTEETPVSEPTPPADAQPQTGPHSWACGFVGHPHGTRCASDCPTCHPDVLAAEREPRGVDVFVPDDRLYGGLRIQHPRGHEVRFTADGGLTVFDAKGGPVAGYAFGAWLSYQLGDSRAEQPPTPPQPTA